MTPSEREERLASYDGRPDVDYMRRLAVWVVVIAAGLMAGLIAWRMM